VAFAIVPAGSLSGVVFANGTSTLSITATGTLSAFQVIFCTPFTTLYASRSTADLPATNSAAALFTTDCTAILNSCDQPTTLNGPINDN
jgi:hypothetical protein